MSRDLADEVLEPSPDGPIKRTREQVIAELGERPRVYTITAFGFDWPFVYPAKTSQVDNFPKFAGEFSKRMAVDQAKLPQPYVDALNARLDEDGKVVPMDGADFVNAFTLHYWSDPEQDGGQISEPQALTLVAKDPGTCAVMVNIIEAAMTNGQMLRVSSKVNDQKKGSNSTTKSASDLKPPEPSSEDTPTV